MINPSPARPMTTLEQLDARCEALQQRAASLASGTPHHHQHGSQSQNHGYSHGSTAHTGGFVGTTPHTNYSAALSSAGPLRSVSPVRSGAATARPHWAVATMNATNGNTTAYHSHATTSGALATLSGSGAFVSEEEASQALAHLVEEEQRLQQALQQVQTHIRAYRQLFTQTQGQSSAWSQHDWRSSSVPPPPPPPPAQHQQQQQQQFFTPQASISPPRAPSFHRDTIAGGGAGVGVGGSAPLGVGQFYPQQHQQQQQQHNGYMSPAPHYSVSAPHRADSQPQPVPNSSNTAASTYEQQGLSATPLQHHQPQYYQQQQQQHFASTPHPFGGGTSSATQSPAAVAPFDANTTVQNHHNAADGRAIIGTEDIFNELREIRRAREAREADRRVHAAYSPVGRQY